MKDIQAVIAEMQRRLPDNWNDDSHTMCIYLNPRQLRDWIVRLQAEGK